MAECGTDAQIHVCRYEGGPQAWPSERRTGALSWRRTLLANSQHVPYFYVFLSAFSLIKQESQERGFKIHTVLKR